MKLIPPSTFQEKVEVTIEKESYETKCSLLGEGSVEGKVVSRSRSSCFTMKEVFIFSRKSRNSWFIIW